MGERFDWGAVLMVFHKKPDSIINVKVKFGKDENVFDDITERVEAYKPRE